MLHFFLFFCNSGGGKIASMCCEISAMYLARPASPGSRTSIRCKLQVTHLTSASEGQGDRGVLGTRGGSTDLGQEAEAAAKHGQSSTALEKGTGRWGETAEHKVGEVSDSTVH